MRYSTRKNWLWFLATAAVLIVGPPLVAELWQTWRLDQ